MAFTKFIVLIGLLFLTSDALSHSRLAKVCFNLNLNFIGDEILENGLLAEHYDRNKDKKADVTLLSFVVSTDDKKTVHRSFPLFYIVDENFDGIADKVYIDRAGDGRCSEIVLYEDLTIPHEPNLTRRGGNS